MRIIWGLLVVLIGGGLLFVFPPVGGFVIYLGVRMVWKA